MGKSASTERARSFVRGAHLATVAGAAAPSRGEGTAAAEATPLVFDQEQAEAWVVGPQLVGFVRGVTPERRNAVIRCTQFATLYADGQGFERHSDQWLDQYTDALKQLGWVLEESMSRDYNKAVISGEVHEAIMDFVAVLGVGGSAAALVGAALKAMQKASDDQPWITIFNSRSDDQSLDGFQVGLVDEDPLGLFQIRLMTFRLNLRQKLTQVLFFKFANANAELHSLGRRMTIDEELIYNVMPDLVAMLTSRTKGFIARALLPPVRA